MQPSQTHAAEPSQTPRRPAPRSADPGEAGRQHKARRRIDCDGARESSGVPAKGRGASPSRETPRHYR